MRTALKYAYYFSGSEALPDQYQLVLDRATALGYTKPDAAQQELHFALWDTIESGLGESGMAKLKRFYLPANNGSTEFGTLNWVDPSIKQASLVNSPTWASNRGWTSNGTTSYVRPPFLTTEYAGIKDNVSFMIYSSKVDDVNDNSDLWGALTSTTEFVLIRTKSSSTALSIYQYSAATPNIAVADRGGMYHNRILTGNFAIFRNATKTARTPTTVTPTGGSDHGLLCRNNTAKDGTFTPAGFNAKEYASFLLIAEALTDAEHTVIYNAFETYRAAISLT